MAHPEPTGEEEEHHGSPWPVIIAIGMGVGYVGIVSVSIPMLLVGLAIFGGGLGGWIHQDLPRPSSAFYGAISAIESKFPRVSARALGAIERGNQKRLRLFLAATLLLGITFLSIQAFEYQHLYFGEHLTFKSAPFNVNPLYGPTFYAQTGVHGSHVTAGVIGMAYVTRKAFKGGFTKENHEAVELVGLYWHFVDVVWIFLFTIVYLI